MRESRDSQNHTRSSIACVCCGEDTVLGPGPGERECLLCSAWYSTLDAAKWRQAPVEKMPGSGR